MLDDNDGTFSNEIVGYGGAGDEMKFIGRTCERIGTKAACLAKLMPGIMCVTKCISNGFWVLKRFINNFRDGVF